MAEEKEFKRKKMSRDEQIENIRMNLEESKALRAKNHQDSIKKANESNGISEFKRRESFQEYWTANRRSFGKVDNAIENVLWVHLKAIKCDEPSKFEKGCLHFGLKKINKRPTNL